MDNLTHAMLGLTINNLLSGTRRNRGTFWVSLVASELPDIDILYRFKGAAEYMLNHRGISHSVVGIVLCAGVITLLSRRMFPENRSRLIFLLALGCLGTHVLFDLFTSWGTQFLVPFSNKYFYLDYLPIVDFVIIAVLVFFLVLGRIHGSHRNKAAILAVVFVCGFVLTRGITHHNLLEHMQRAYPGAQVAVLPSLSPLSWQAVVDSGHTLIRKDIVWPAMVIQREIHISKENKVPIALYQDNEEFKRVVNCFRKPVWEINEHRLVVRDLFYGFREVFFPLNEQGEIVGRATAGGRHVFMAK